MSSLDVSTNAPFEATRAAARMVGGDLWFCPRCDSDLDGERCPYDGALGLRLVQTECVQPLAKGDRVGSFVLERPLGSGGHGMVWLASQASGVGDAAVKLLRPEGCDRAALRRFFREAEIGARLRHASAVRVFEFGQHPGGMVWLAMELLPGVTLEAALHTAAVKGEAMAPARVVSLFAGALGGLAEAHALGVVHRDLKPRNLMLVSAGGDEQLKVLDFGVARLLGTTMTDVGQVLGTAATMSPEQCEGREVDARSDLYSVGVVLFRCLTSVWPFPIHDPMATMYAHIHAPVPDLTALADRAIPPRLAALVMRALAKAPGDRFEDALAMRAALLESVEGVATTALADPPRPLTPAPMRALSAPWAGDGTRRARTMGTEPEAARRRGWQGAAWLLSGAGMVVAAAGWLRSAGGATAGSEVAERPVAAARAEGPAEVAPSRPATLAETAKVETAKVETAKVETAKVETAKVETAKVETAKVETAAEPATPAAASAPVPVLAAQHAQDERAPHPLADTGRKPRRSPPRRARPPAAVKLAPTKVGTPARATPTIAAPPRELALPDD